MKYDPNVQHRRSIRLKHYDYSQAGAYYVTIVAQNRVYLFGSVVDREMQLNAVGEMLRAQWDALPERFPNVELDEFIVMPNHIHGIIVIANEEGRPQGIAPTDNAAHHRALGNIVGAWKSIVTDEYIRGVRGTNWPPFERRLWQRNYYEHVIRDDSDLERIREYIVNNPVNWQWDENNRDNLCESAF